MTVLDRRDFLRGAGALGVTAAPGPERLRRRLHGRLLLPGDRGYELASQPASQPAGRPANSQYAAIRPLAMGGR